MATKRAGWAFFSGLGAAFLVLVCALLSLSAAFAHSDDSSWLPNDRTEGDETFLAVAYVLIPFTFWVASVLPARALGLSWLGSFLVSGAALSALLLPILAPGPYQGGIVAAVVLAPALVALSWLRC